MKKRIISVLLIIALVVAFVGVRPLVMNDTTSYAVEYRNGYAIVPQKMDGTGVSTVSTFLFVSENEVTVEELQNALVINPTTEFTVTKGTDGLIITPVKELKSNSLYTFDYNGTTWSFQTKRSFAILGTLPGNETSGVPVNTGIEIYFSHEGAEVEDYFSIEPKAEGKFETHGSTVVFVPKELKEKTIYTVTLKKGLPLSESEQILGEDYIFSFETMSEDESYVDQTKGYFSFNNTLNDFGTGESPKIPMYYYLYDQEEAGSIQTKVYGYNNIDDFVDSFKEYFEQPYWSIYAVADSKISTENLNEVMSFEQPLDLNTYGQQFLNLPDRLPAGYYLVDCTWEDIRFQTFIQVTDLSYYFIDAINSDLFWINDLGTKKAVVGATVNNITNNDSGTSDGNGIAKLSSEAKEDEYYSLYTIKKENQSAIAVLNNFNTYGYSYGSTTNFYWRYLQLDRNLYQPDDTVNFFGFVQNRYKDEDIQGVTVELSNGYTYYYDYFYPYASDEMALLEQEVSVKNGFYEGSFKLPNLEEGSYQLSIKLGDKTISSSYVQVQKYKKPAYKIEVSSDPKAVFVGEPITFTAKTSFFEGTPVANLDVNYNLWGLENANGATKTDLNGEVKIEYTPQYVEGNQGLFYQYFDGYASLPEFGQIYGNAQTMVFINDIEASVVGSIKDHQGTLDVKVNQIDINKANSSDEDYTWDYLGAPVSGQTLTGTIYKNTWKKKEVGEYYDFINKVVQKQYEYYTEQTVYQQVSLTTDTEGKASHQITFDDYKDSYYTVILNTTDKKGRSMKYESYFGGYYYYTPYDSEYYSLTSEKEVYNLQDQVTVDFKKGDELFTAQSFLFTTAQNGLIDYTVQSSGHFSTQFTSEFIPNAEIDGVAFNGKTYIVASSFNPRLDTENNRIEFTVTTDQESYKPGETVIVTLKAEIFDQSKQKVVGAKDVAVNVSVVDEALFKLSDQNVDTLNSLYEWVPSGIVYTYGSHKNEGYNSIRYEADGYSVNKAVAYDIAMEESLPSVDQGLMKDEAETALGGEVRSDFKDTAFFSTVYLDENGHGTFEYKLPDNVTSWRMTFAGISSSLMAGTETKEIIVTLPFFINTSLSTTYLVGDTPFIGVSGYGTKLTEGEEIEYTVSCPKMNYSFTASGKAFERVNIPLFEMEEGTFEIIVEAKTANGLIDKIQQKVEVVKTYHQKEKADYYTLVNGLTISTNLEGNTTLTFVDEGRGKFIQGLYSLAYFGGKRVEQRLTAMLASEMLQNTFGIDPWYTEEITLSDYIMEDGGFGILPYAESDIETTVKLLPIVKDEVNTVNIRLYLESALAKDGRLSPIILYGLATLGEPVLLQLDEALAYTDLTLKEYIYLALAYTAVGDTFKAEEIYSDHIAPAVEKFDQVARVKTGKNEDSFLEHTALTMVLASQLNLVERDLFYKYVMKTYSKEILVNVELMTYIQNEINNVTPETVSVTYQYNNESYTKTLDEGWTESIEIPSAKLSDFKVTSITGKGALIAIYRDAFTDSVANDTSLKINRTYQNYYTGEISNVFDQGDIVKVQLNWDISKVAIDDAYTVTDFLPSGLVPIDNPWSLGIDTDLGYNYYEANEQTVTFYVWEGNKENRSLTYYARVISPGTFYSDGVIMQGVNIKDSMLIGPADSITINP